MDNYKKVIFQKTPGLAVIFFCFFHVQAMAVDPLLDSPVHKPQMEEPSDKSARGMLVAVEQATISSLVKQQSASMHCLKKCGMYFPA